MGKERDRRAHVMPRVATITDMAGPAGNLPNLTAFLRELAHAPLDATVVLAVLAGLASRLRARSAAHDVTTRPRPTHDAVSRRCREGRG